MEHQPFRRFLAMILAFALISDPATAALRPSPSSVPAPRHYSLSIFNEQALTGHLVEMLHPLSKHMSVSRAQHSLIARGRHVSRVAVLAAALAVSAAALVSGWHPDLVTWAALPKIFLAAAPLAWVPKPRSRRAAEAFKAYRLNDSGNPDEELSTFYDLLIQGMGGARFVGKGGPRVPKVKVYGLAQNFEDLRKMEATARRVDNRNIYLWGPHGTGKNYKIDLFAAIRNQGRTLISAHEDMTVDDIFERQVLRPAPGSTAAMPLRETRWELNDFAHAMMRGEIGVWDEYNRMPDKVKAALNDALQRRSFTRKDGTVVKFHDDALVVATSNPPDDKSGATYTTGEQVSRFNNIEVQYLGADEEAELLMEVAPGVPEDVIRSLVAVAGDIRAAKRTTSGSVVTPLSTRELVMLVQHFQYFPSDLKHVNHVFKQAYLPGDDQPEVETLVERLLLNHGFADEAYPDLQPTDWEIVTRDVGGASQKYLRIGDVEAPLRAGTNHIPERHLKEAQKQPQNLRYLQDLLKAVVLKQHILLEGEAGVGKDWALDILFNALEYPVYIEPINENTTADDIMGWYELKGSLQEWQDSKLEKAVRANAIYYLSEINRCKPGTMAAIYNFMENGFVQLANQETLDARDKDRFLVVASANPNRRPYSAYPMPGALRSRFKKIRMESLPEKEEVGMLAGDYPEVAIEVVKRLVKGANVLRKAHKQGTGTIPYQVGVRLLQQVLESLTIDPDNYLGQSAIETFLDGYGAISQGSDLAEVVKDEIRKVLMGSDVKLHTIDLFKPVGIGEAQTDAALKRIQSSAQAGHWSGVQRGLIALADQPMIDALKDAVAEELGRIANLAGVTPLRDAILEVSQTAPSYAVAAVALPVNTAMAQTVSASLPPPETDVQTVDLRLVPAKQMWDIPDMQHDVLHGKIHWIDGNTGGFRLIVDYKEGMVFLFRDHSKNPPPSLLFRAENGRAILNYDSPNKTSKGEIPVANNVSELQLWHSKSSHQMILVLDEKCKQSLDAVLPGNEWRKGSDQLVTVVTKDLKEFLKEDDLVCLYESSTKLWKAPPHAPAAGSTAEDLDLAQDINWAKQVMAFDRETEHSKNRARTTYSLSDEVVRKMLSAVADMKVAIVMRKMRNRDVSRLRAILLELAHQELFVGEFNSGQYQDAINTTDMKDAGREVRIQAQNALAAAGLPAIISDELIAAKLADIWDLNDEEAARLRDFFDRHEPFGWTVRQGSLWNAAEFTLMIAPGAPVEVMRRMIDDLNSLRGSKDAWVLEKFNFRQLKSEQIGWVEESAKDYEIVSKLARSEVLSSSNPVMSDVEVRDLARDKELLGMAMNVHNQRNSADTAFFIPQHNSTYALGLINLESVERSIELIAQEIRLRKVDPARQTFRLEYILKWLASMSILVESGNVPWGLALAFAKGHVRDISESVRVAAGVRLREFGFTPARSPLDFLKLLHDTLGGADVETMSRELEQDKLELKTTQTMSQMLKSLSIQPRSAFIPIRHTSGVGMLRMFVNLLQTLEQDPKQAWIAENLKLNIFKVELENWQAEEIAIHEVLKALATLKLPESGAHVPVVDTSAPAPRVLALTPQRAGASADAKAHVIFAVKEALGLADEHVVIDDQIDEDFVVEEEVQEGVVHYTKVTLNPLALVPAAVTFILEKIKAALPPGRSSDVLQQKILDWKISGSQSSVGPGPTLEQNASVRPGPRAFLSPMEIFQESFDALPLHAAMTDRVPNMKHYLFKSDVQSGQPFSNLVTFGLGQSDRIGERSAYFTISTADRPVTAPFFELNYTEKRNQVELVYSLGDPSQGTYEEHETMIPASVFRGYKLIASVSENEIPHVLIYVAQDGFKGLDQGFVAGYTQGVQSRKPGVWWSFVQVEKDELEHTADSLPPKQPYTIPTPARKADGFDAARKIALHAILSKDSSRIAQMDDYMNAGGHVVGKKYFDLSERLEADQISTGDILIHETDDGSVHLSQANGPLDASTGWVSIDPLIKNRINFWTLGQTHKSSFQSGKTRRLATAEELGNLQQYRVHASLRSDVLEAVRDKSMQALLHYEEVLHSDEALFKEWWDHPIDGPVQCGDLLLVDRGDQGKRFLFADHNYSTSGNLRAVSADGRETIDVQVGNFRKVASASETPALAPSTDPVVNLIKQTVSEVFDVEPYVSLMVWMSGPGILGANVEYQNPSRPLLIGLSVGNDTPAEEIFMRLVELIRNLWKDNQGPDAEEFGRRVDRLEAIARGSESKTNRSMNEKVVFSSAIETAHWLGAAFKLSEGQLKQLLDTIIFVRGIRAENIAFHDRSRPNEPPVLLSMVFGGEEPSSVLKTVSWALEKAALSSNVDVAQMIALIKDKLDELNQPNADSLWRREVMDYLWNVLDIPVIFAPIDEKGLTTVEFVTDAAEQKVIRIVINTNHLDKAAALGTVLSEIQIYGLLRMQFEDKLDSLMKKVIEWQREVQAAPKSIPPPPRLAHAA